MPEDPKEFPCEDCGKPYKTERGLKVHQTKKGLCKGKPEDEPAQPEIPPEADTGDHPIPPTEPATGVPEVEPVKEPKKETSGGGKEPEVEIVEEEEDFDFPLWLIPIILIIVAVIIAIMVIWKDRKDKKGREATNPQYFDRRLTQ